MAQAPAMPVFTDALIGDTTHLSAEEFGCYCLLLFATWRNNGQPFPDSAHDLARICRVTLRRWKAVMRGRLAGFFDLAEGTWRQKRLEKEWRRCARLSAISRSNGARGGRPQSNDINGKKNPAGCTQGSFASESISPSTETLSPEAAREADKQKRANSQERRKAPPKSPSLKREIKDRLRQKLIRFVNSRLHGEEKSKAIAGLCGAEPDHDEQWWMDAIDRRMRAVGWDDTRGWKPSGLRRVA